MKETITFYAVFLRRGSSITRIGISIIIIIITVKRPITDSFIFPVEQH